jgi:hypothetical protein
VCPQFQTLKYVTKFHENWYDRHKIGDKFNPLKTKFLINNIKNLVRALQEMYYVSVTKINQLMLFRETISVYWKNHAIHKYTLWEDCKYLEC